jgi:hypothetical protein
MTCLIVYYIEDLRHHIGKKDAYTMFSGINVNVQI